jgi:hypothetical protein
VTPVTDFIRARSAWESFYVIIGSSGGALIGVQFVVMTLIGERRHRTTSGTLSAFATPTVVHLTGALVVSAIMSAPWPSSLSFFSTVGVTGLAGLAYGPIVIRRARRQTTYAPVWQDWVWYTVLPCLSYAALAGAALVRANVQAAFFAIAAAALGLLLIGIHNAWDTVTHLVVSQGGMTDD